MDEMDPGATQRRIDQITEAGLRALDDAAEQAAEIDRVAAEEAARREEAIQASLDEAARKKAEREEQAAQQQPPSAWANRPTRPTYLALGGEELQEHQRPASPLPPPLPVPVPPAAPPEPPAAEPPREAPRDRYLSFGSADEEGAPPARSPRPAPTRPAPRDDEDDDWASRSWMRR